MKKSYASSLWFRTVLRPLPDTGGSGEIRFISMGSSINLIIYFTLQLWLVYLASDALEKYRHGERHKDDRTMPRFIMTLRWPLHGTWRIGGQTDRQSSYYRFTTFDDMEEIGSLCFIQCLPRIYIIYFSICRVNYLVSPLILKNAACTTTAEKGRDK